MSLHSHSIRVALDGTNVGHHLDVSVHAFPDAPEPVWFQLGPAYLPLSEEKALELATALTDAVTHRRNAIAHEEFAS